MVAIQGRFDKTSTVRSNPGYVGRKLGRMSRTKTSGTVTTTGGVTRSKRPADIPNASATETIAGTDEAASATQPVTPRTTTFDGAVPAVVACTPQSIAGPARNTNMEAAPTSQQPGVAAAEAATDRSAATNVVMTGSDGAPLVNDEVRTLTQAIYLMMTTVARLEARMNGIETARVATAAAATDTPPGNETEALETPAAVTTPETTTTPSATTTTPTTTMATTTTTTTRPVVSAVAATVPRETADHPRMSAATSARTGPAMARRPPSPDSSGDSSDSSPWDSSRKCT
ncbi:unnamed protein product [Phytophthora fragariaefolia]|uniref:Unnamed protein product n=1 Tax=Phytophthora fragariaefolia TaxID=1490495 RepID=A0A9W7CXF7_9STRA|nr:unnamed protein product [Phytophthora fragariaefolia]